MTHNDVGTVGCDCKPRGSESWIFRLARPGLADQVRLGEQRHCLSPTYSGVQGTLHLVRPPSSVPMRWHYDIPFKRIFLLLQIKLTLSGSGDGDKRSRDRAGAVDSLSNGDTCSRVTFGPKL